jgi:hypothetical protein
MKAYQTSVGKLSGTDYREVHKKASLLYKRIKARSKRRPYIRSVYFKKDKIFLGVFWEHLMQKSWWDQLRRLKFLPCAFDLIQNSKYEPESKQNPNKPSEILHRFAGLSQNNELFIVQIKEDKNSDQKWLLSVFPKESQK